VETRGTPSEGWNAPGGLRQAVQAADGGAAASDGGGASDGGQGWPRLSGTGCIVGRSLRWSGATVAHLSCKQVVAGSIPVSSSMTSPSPGRASLLMLPGEGLVPSAAQKVSYVARFTMKPLPVRVFQQVMPSKRLVQAMSP